MFVSGYCTNDKTDNRHSNYIIKGDLRKSN